MKSIAVTILIVFSALAIWPKLAVASDRASTIPKTLLIYKDENGELSANSNSVVQLLQRAAGTNGFVELWLYLDSEALFGTKTVSDDQYKRACVNILQRLVNAGQVQHPTSGPSNKGPVCFVRASRGAVAILAKETRFKQVMGSTHLH